MAKFSANLGFLWKELALPDAIAAAARAGFDAVECHLPYAHPAGEIDAALRRHGVPMIGLNVLGDDTPAGAFGLTALPGRQVDARARIDQAIDYAAAVGARHVHVMAGLVDDSAEPRRTFVDNLGYAAARAAAGGVTVVIEPLNVHDAPGYFLNRIEQAVEILGLVGAANAKVMFDCYHVQTMQGDLLRRLETHLDVIGHVQFAGVPGRREPDEGEVAYERLFDRLYAMGYDGYLGAEYAPRSTTDEGLAWLARMRAGARSDQPAR